MHNVELRPSKIHGVGVYALTRIGQGTVLFSFNGVPSSQSINLSSEDVKTLPDYVQKSIQAVVLPNRDGSYPVPKHDVSCALELSWYLNSSHGTEYPSNDKFIDRRDASGYSQIVTTKDVEEGDELLLSYSEEL